MDDGISPDGKEKLNEPQSTEAPRVNAGKVLQLKLQLRTAFESTAKRRESEVMQCIKELTKSMTNLADVQLRRESLQTTAENNIDSIVKKVVEQSRDSIQAMVSSSIKDTLNEVFSKSREQVRDNISPSKGASQGTLPSGGMMHNFRSHSHRYVNGTMLVPYSVLVIPSITFGSVHAREVHGPARSVFSAAHKCKLVGCEAAAEESEDAQLLGVAILN
ncbi:hypothetical protein FGB62_148g06 [Gracilaria domingensis]|nr:hypothetical protein FGB62_148g06 [Gracilaria domingensis]